MDASVRNVLFTSIGSWNFCGPAVDTFAGENLTYLFGDFELESGQRVLRSVSTGQVVSLTPRAFDLLLVFVKRPNVLIAKAELMKTLWPDTIVEENNLDRAVFVLRQAVGERRGEHRYIKTIHRRGYQFTAPVQVVSKPPSLSFPPATPTIVSPPSAPSRYASIAIAVGSLLAFCVIAIVWGVGHRTTHQAVSVGSLAILPFRPVVDSDRNEALQFGIAETLIAGLDRPGLHVLPLSSVRKFSAPDSDVLAAGRELGVEAVLEGHLQWDGNRLRVTARLVRVTDGAQLWSDRYDENFTDVFSVQDVIAAKVWKALKPELSDTVAPGLRRYTADTDAYQLYLNGRYYREQRLNGDDIRRALDFFEQATVRDPEFALAWVGMADAYCLLGVFGTIAPRDAFPQARRAVDRALELDPALGAAHVALGHIKTQFEHDWRGAEAQYIRALELDPNYAFAHQLYGLHLAFAGKFDQALEELHKAQALEPAVPNYSAVTGLILNFAGRRPEAVVQLKKVLAMDERQSLARAFLAMTYLQKGAYAAALAEFERTNGGAPFCTGCRGQIYARMGKIAEAQEEAARLISLSHQRYVSAYDIAAVFAALGQIDTAFEWLDKAFDERAQHVMWLPWDPAFDGLRRDTRYAVLSKRLNLQ